MTTQASSMTTVTAGFSSLAGFELLQRMAKMFNTSALVPKIYRGEQNFGNCCIALNMAQRLQADPLMVMQNLYVVYGNPGWSAKFLIATFNECGRYSSIHYKETGKKGTDSWGCIAYATELATGEMLEGPEVTIQTAKSEGWYNKDGSKWKTMPQQMLRYRAAAWFIRTTAPELSMGLQTVEEIEDTHEEKNITPPVKEIAENANTTIFEPKEAAQIKPAAKTIDVKPDPENAEDKQVLKAAPKAQPEPAMEAGPDF